MVTWTTFYGSRSKSQWFWDTKLSSGSYPQHCIKINTTGKSTKQQFFIDYRTIEHLRKSIIFRDHGWTKTTFYMLQFLTDPLLSICSLHIISTFRLTLGSWSDLISIQQLFDIIRFGVVWSEPDSWLIYWSIIY